MRVTSTPGRQVLQLCLVVATLLPTSSLAQRKIIDGTFHHLRNASTREWSSFPSKPETSELIILFSSKANAVEQTLILRQYDVKMTWNVEVNDKPIGTLTVDEKDMFCYLPIKPGFLREGQNKVRIWSSDKEADDIRVGEVFLDSRPLRTILTESTLMLETVNEMGTNTPCHFAIVDTKGILQPLAASKDAALAIRTGHVYSANGKAEVRLPAGTYTIYAGRGFEYGVDSTVVSISRGARENLKFSIRREVDTRGFVSSDTHIHTFSHSRHGDATDRERVITLAGEGIELPIITDHNQHIDLENIAVDVSVDHYLTLVTGNELTTAVGHFNLFPVGKDEPVVDATADSWTRLSQAVRSENRKAVILNHARDIHRGFRPFDPKMFLQATGTRTDNQPFFANAMEVLNSGSQQSDIMQLTRDWFGMLNHGHVITPVGGSDSHDVSRFIVGQGRTYIRCDDSAPGQLDTDDAIESFLKGHVMVSAGLLARIVVNDDYGPGDLVPRTKKTSVSIQVEGPAWTRADHVALFANGIKVREAAITGDNEPGIKWKQTWQLDTPPYDVYYVVVAQGPDVEVPIWPLAKPFQPASEVWTPKVIGISGAVWVDGDGNGEINPARDYAVSLISRFKNTSALIKALSDYDAAVASQVAVLLWEKGVDLNSSDIQSALTPGAAHTRAGFEATTSDLNNSVH